MFVIATYYPAETGKRSDISRASNIFDILTHMCVTAFAGDGTYTPAPTTKWHMRNSLGRIVAAGESGQFTIDLCDNVKEQLHCMPLTVSFDNGIYYEVFREEDYDS